MTQYYIVLTGTRDGTGRSGNFYTATANDGTVSCTVNKSAIYTFKI